MSAVYGAGGESDATDIALFLLRPSPQSGVGYAGARDRPNNCVNHQVGVE